MWDRIKEFFVGGEGPPIIIEPVKFEDGLLKFKCQEKLKLKATKLYAPSKIGHIEVQMEVLSFDKETGTYRGKMKDETFALDAMQMGKRKEFRLETTVPFLTEDVKDKRGVTEDISLSGARLRTSQALKPGSFVGIELKFSDPTIDDLPLRCEVVWCAPTRKGQFHSGVRFFTIEKAQKAVLKRYIQNKVALGI